MPHHIVFSYLPGLPPDAPADAKPPRQKEVWITYPMISYCCLKPLPPVLRQEPSIRIRCRDFTYFAFYFPDEKRARDVYDSIRALSCKVGRLDKLLAFSYQPKPPEDEQNGWDIYDARREWKGWRKSEINTEYKVGRRRCCCGKGLMHGAVFQDISCPPRRPLECLRQRPQICRRVPLTAANTCPRLPSPHQQLLHHTELAADAGYTRQPKCSRRKACCSHMGYEPWVESDTTAYAQIGWPYPRLKCGESERIQR
jgi:hypothetical protein